MPYKIVLFKLIFLSVFFLSTKGQAQNFDKAKMDSLFMLIGQHQEGMGSVSIFQEGKEVYRNSTGFEDIAKQTPNTADTRFRIGSISKTFASVLIMMLVEEGKITLETPLAKFFPQVQNAQDITIRHLLNHRSGIGNVMSTYEPWMSEPITKADLLAKIVAAGSEFQPDVRNSYSNPNYILLTFIIEALEKQDYKKVLKKRICKPLGLQNTYHGGKAGTKPREALSYSKRKKWERTSETDMSVPLGAGALVSTATDLNIFLCALFQGKLVQEKSLAEMCTQKDEMGLGLFQISFYQKKALGHTGGIDGFESNAFYFPKEKVSVVYLSNAVATPVNDIMIGLLSICFGQPYQLPSFLPTYKVTAEDLDPYLGVYASPTFPLKITITKEEDQLIGQGTGQPSFLLTPFAKHQFRFKEADVEIRFIPERNILIIKQEGVSQELAKE